MPDINISSLKDKALDVDPDLRFMALEDFKKLLECPSNKTTSKGIESFIPFLQRLLKDSNTNVQSQAVKTFGLIVHHISPLSILNLLNELYDEILQENKNTNGYKIITSIPNMALRNIFGSGYRFPYQLSRNILNAFIPRLLNNAISIDSIELLIDIVKTLGFVLDRLEIYSLLTTTTDISFTESGIISKRAVVAFTLLLNYLEDSHDTAEVLNPLVSEMTTKFETVKGNPNAVRVHLTLLSSVLNSLQILKKASEDILNDSTIEHILCICNGYLRLDDLETDLDTEDYDFDTKIQENLVREDAMNTINDLINAVPYKSFQKHLHETTELVKTFINYDPLHLPTSDDEFGTSDNESEIEFSDDEDGINNGEDYSNDCSWKLRAKSAVIIKSLACRYTQVLPLIYTDLSSYLIKSISDRNELVSDDSIQSLITVINLTSPDNEDSFYSYNNGKRRGSDVSMAGETDALNQLITKVSPQLEKTLFETLFKSKKSAILSNVLKLVESLIVNNEELSTDFLEKLYHSVEELDFATSGNLEFLTLYKTIVQKNDLSEIPKDFLNFILNELSICLYNKKVYYNVITETLNLTILIISRICQLQDLNQYRSKLKELYLSVLSIAMDKDFSGEIRDKAIAALAEFLINGQVNEDELLQVLQIYKQALNSEATVKSALELLKNVFISEGPHLKLYSEQSDFLSFVIERLGTFISSSDDTLGQLSIGLFHAITSWDDFVGMDLKNANKYVNILMNLSEKTNNSQDLFLLFNIISKLVHFCQVDESFVRHLVQIVNTKLEEVDDFNTSSLEHLIKKISTIYLKEDLNEILMAHLNQKLFISAKIIAVLTIEKSLNQQVVSVEEELHEYIAGQVNLPDDRVIFDVQFLGNIGSKMELDRVELEGFMKLLEHKSKAIRLASARSIGLLVSRNTDKYLGLLLKSYGDSSSQRDLNLISLKQIVSNKELNSQVLQDIWNNIWNTIGCKTETELQNAAELRLSGDVISKICLRDTSFISKVTEKALGTDTDSIMYTIVVILKQLISSSRGNDDFVLLQQFVLKSLRFFESTNIEVKQALVGTVLTGLHNKPSLILPYLSSRILPYIYQELTAKDEFKKIIPMGPYKYVIDEGLEIRKLSYELLYTIIAIDFNSIRANKIDLDQIGRKIIANGLRDNETDVVVLSSITLTSLINKDPNFLVADDRTLADLIDVLKFNLNKKLKSKASAQESETFEENIKSIIRLSNAANTSLSASNFSYSPWDEYYSEMKSLYLQLYNTVSLD